jgi:hypothetical protein
MKVINPRGVTIDIPDEWKGNKLNDMIKDGFQLIEEKVEVSIPEPETIKIEQEIESPFETLYVEAKVDEVDVPKENLRIINSKGVMKRLPGHGTPTSAKRRKGGKYGKSN